LHFSGGSPIIVFNMNTQPTFLRRIGSDLQKYCAQTAGCPDIWELDNGDFAVIVADITDAAASKLPPTAGCGPGERIVPCRAICW
jgi:hypothetical protein